MEFRWNNWNIDHIAEHGVPPEEAEAVVQNAKPPYPRYQMDGKWLVWGRGSGGRPLQVIYILDPDDTKFIIHARPLTQNESKRLRRRHS